METEIFYFPWFMGHKWLQLLMLTERDELMSHKQNDKHAEFDIIMMIKVVVFDLESEKSTIFEVCHA